MIMMILFGAVEIGRLFYTYHALQKALRGGATLLARSVNVEYCNTTDLTMADVRNFIVYGNLQGEGAPVVPGLTVDMIQILPERSVIDSNTVVGCLCTEDPDGCDSSLGGRAPDFVVLNLGDGFPLALPFPYVSLGTVNLRVSVGMPVTGG